MTRKSAAKSILTHYPPRTYAHPRARERSIARGLAVFSRGLNFHLAGRKGWQMGGGIFPRYPVGVSGPAG
jgi:hypothetical protein